MYKELYFSKKYVSLKDSLEFKYIPLETTDSCLVGIANDIQIIDKRLFILDGQNFKNLFVFSTNGDFITRVGNTGNGPGEFSRIFSFDIDTVKRLIIISEKYQEYLLYYDLDTYEYKYSKKTNFYYNHFSPRQNGDLVFIGYNGFENPTKKNDHKKYYILTTDSLLEKKAVSFEAKFTTSYSLNGGGKPNLYTYNKTNYIYHHLFPDIYRLEKNEIRPVYKLNVDSYKFPSVDYMKSISGNNDDYTRTLKQSDYITNYHIDECNSLISLSIQKNNEFIQGVYNKKTDTGYVLNLADYFKSINLGMLLHPISATDNYIIGVLNVEKNTHQYVKDSLLKDIIKNRTPENNPIICLYKWKNN